MKGKIPMLEQLREEVFESLLELPKNQLVTMHSGTVSGRDAETNLVVIKPLDSANKLTPGIYRDGP
jgi:ribulose-5-phosphate 4-epimerase/fuculose-1-phosphate aldolase